MAMELSDSDTYLKSPFFPKDYTSEHDMAIMMIT